MNTHTDERAIVPGLEAAGVVHRNLDRARLIEAAVRRGEAELAATGALAARTGAFTGRSPGDKYVVAGSAIEDAVDWRANEAMPPEAFAGLKRRALAHAAGRELFVQDLQAGADPRHRLNVRVVTEEAWHALFARNMFVRPEAEGLEGFVPDWTVLQLPSFKAEPGNRRHGLFDRDRTRLRGNALVPRRQTPPTRARSRSRSSPS